MILIDFENVLKVSGSDWAALLSEDQFLKSFSKSPRAGSYSAGEKKGRAPINYEGRVGN